MPVTAAVCAGLMINAIALLTAGFPLLAVPLTAGALRRRPLSDLDRRLSAVDAELDARPRPLRSC